MILPTKNINLNHCLLGIGGHILKMLDSSNTISGIWEKIREDRPLLSYETFLLTMDFLFAINAITFSDGIIRKNRRGSNAS